jgi:hypothetical protein
MRALTLGGIAFVLLIPFWIYFSYARAKFRAFKTSAKRVPFWGGAAELILWEPGETIVILQEKRLIPMSDPHGGYRIVSAWRGQEYKGRISYKTQFSTWKSGPIHTSDGMTVHLALGTWWRIADANVYTSAIASDYHENQEHLREDLGNAAELWIEKLTAGTLREHVNKLPTAKLISPYVEAYVSVDNSDQPLQRFSELLEEAKDALDAKTRRYGIEIERIEVQELTLPSRFQEKLEGVRVAFLEPYEAEATTKARTIALEGLASVIGRDKVGLIEILKHIDLSKTQYPPLGTVMPMFSPIVGAVEESAKQATSLPNAVPAISPGGPK